MMALRTAATGMAAQDLNVDVISNNIANMNTVGFKKGRAEFEDLLYQDLEQVGSQSSSTGTIVPTGVQVGAGVKAGSVYRITTQGSLTQTGNSLDLAINGRGFFQVLTPTGDNLFMQTDASGAPTVGEPTVQGMGSLMQGYTEASNVDPVSEI
ncbi:MAG TPA: flagellar hook-basal body complex protein, partial [Caulobacteraceae bacterium]